MFVLCSASAFAQDVKKETIGETESLYKPTNQNDGVQSTNDIDLLKMDWAANNPYKKVKRLKTWGWIGGGALAAFGVVCIAVGANSDDGAMNGLGAGCIALGAGVTTLCLVKANKEKKKIDAALQTSSIYRYDIPLSNGSSLSVGADMLNDRIMNKRTVGLGLTYNF